MILFENRLSLLYGWFIRLSLNSSVLRFLYVCFALFFAYQKSAGKENVDILSHVMIFSLSFLTVHNIKIEKSTDFTF